jgi:hypothetical protein
VPGTTPMNEKARPSSRALFGSAPDYSSLRSRTRYDSDPGGGYVMLNGETADSLAAS